MFVRLALAAFIASALLWFLGSLVFTIHTSHFISNQEKITITQETSARQTMANSSFDRDVLRRNLSAALSESLLDIGDIEDAARRAYMNVQSQQQNPFGTRPMLPFFSSSSQGATSQGLFPHQQQQQQQQPQLLLMLAQQQQDHARLLERARTAVLVAQEREQLLLHRSYQSLLQNKLTTAAPPCDHYSNAVPCMITDALRCSLSSQVIPQRNSNLASLLAQQQQQAKNLSHQHSLASLYQDSVPSSSTVVVKSTEVATKALETLGSRLRTSVDPYIDVSSIIDEQPAADEEARQAKRTRGGVTEPFPEKLHRMLADVQAEGLTDIISFFSHGRAFAVHDMERFVAEIMPRFFKQSKWNSFARQLNLYGFQRLLTGPDAGGYYHELFLKGRPNLVVHMRRVGVPHGKDRRKFKQPQARTVEPDFYSMKRISFEN